MTELTNSDVDAEAEVADLKRRLQVAISIANDLARICATPDCELKVGEAGEVIARLEALKAKT